MIAGRNNSNAGDRPRYLVLTPSDPEGVSGRPRVRSGPCVGVQSYILSMSFERDP